MSNAGTATGTLGSGADGGRRIVLTTFGSLGDLHPYIALALGLRRRGHRPVVASLPRYRAKVEATGVEFCALASFGNKPPDPEMMRRAMDRRRGTEFVVRSLIMPVLRETYEDTLAAAKGADLLVAHPLTVATRMVAAARGIPWASTQLAPCGFVSPHDPPIFAPAPILTRLRPLGPRVNGPILRYLKRSVEPWSEPVHRLRVELGLPPEVAPLFEGNHSPDLVLALFSKLLGAPQRDWPTATVVTGFPFYDEDGSPGLDPELAAFLDAGPPPIVFTLGSAAVLDAGRFYEEGAEAARRLGRRAVLLVGRETGNRPPNLPEGVLACDYAPYSELFPRAAAIVHQGGVGTTGQAMRSGRPMLIVPYSHDQPDNADRVRRLGIARVLPRTRFTATRVVRELAPLLDDGRYADRAALVAREVRGEAGVELACNALEALLAARPLR